MTNEPNAAADVAAFVPIPSFQVLGIRVAATSIPGAVHEIVTRVRTRTPGYVCVRDVHGVVECQRDRRLKDIHNAAALVTPDGMPLVWMGKLAGMNVERVYGPDLLLAACDATQGTGIRHFFYGGGDGVAGLLVDRLKARFPSLAVAGTLTPPFRPLSKDEDRAECLAINSANADVVWVGLSTPKQEHWMSAHRDRLAAPVLVGVGAAFDFHAGLKPQAPLWMQRSGLEWLFRLATEPRRLWKRYLRNNPLFVYYTFLQLTGLRRF